MKVKVDYNSLEFGDFLQLRWGTLLSSIVRRWHCTILELVLGKRELNLMSSG